MQPAVAPVYPTANSARASAMVEYKLFFGAQIGEHAREISPLLSIYGEWPYLYRQLNPLEDVTYIQERYAEQPDSIVCIAYQGDKVIGAAMGVPLTQAPQHYRDAFPENERRPDVFYWGELVVLKEFRGEHIASGIYNKMGRHVIDSGKYKAICFASLERDAHYRLRHLQPADYVPLDDLWKRLGFEKRPEIAMQGKWTVLGDSEDSFHEMFYWWKKLE